MNITPSINMLRLCVIILFSIIRSTYPTTYTCNPSLSCGCSTNSAVVTRIVGGEAASSSTWSWAVSVSIANTYLCGGSILSSSWVATAAHCVNGYSASQVTIYAGSTTPISGTQSSVGSKLVVNPNYSTTTYVNDIALLKLATPLSLSDPAVSTICLPSISSATLSAGEWPPVNTSVSNCFQSLIFYNLFFQ
jgi:secreted trypsin-like serine protease